LHSTGQRNSLIECACWTSKVERFARTLVLSAIAGIGLATACFAGALGYTLLGG